MFLTNNSGFDAAYLTGFQTRADNFSHICVFCSAQVLFFFSFFLLN